MYDFHSLPRKRHYSIRLDVIRESVSLADISKPIPLVINYNNNNNNNGLKSDKKDSHSGNGRSWKFWKSMSLRSSKPSSKPVKMDSSLPNLDSQLADVIEKSEFTRSLSYRPPPKPPRSFILRTNSLKTSKPCGPVIADGKHALNTAKSERPDETFPVSVNADDKFKSPVQTSVKDYENVDSEGINICLSEKVDSVPLTVSQKCCSLPNYSLGPTSVTRRQPPKSSGKIRIVSPELTRKVPPRPRKKSAEITAGDRHILILQSAAELICQKIDPFVVIEKLADAGLMDASDLNVFRNPYESRQLCDNIVQSVMDRDYVSFLKFCDILRSVTDYTTVAAVLDAMIAVYDVIYEVQISNGDTSPILDDEKTVSFDVVYYSLETGKIRSVVELEKLRNSENKRHSRDLLSYKRNSRLSFQSFQSLTSEASSIFSEDIITNGLPMVTVSIAGHVLCLEKARSLATVIEDHYCILEFHIGKTHLRGSDMEHISRALALNTCIRVLDLRLNNIGNSGAVYMANVLYQNRTLRQLNLSSTGIDSEGCKLLADSLRTNTSLIDLDLSFLDIGDSGCLALSGMLKQNRCLKKLRLRSGSITWIGCGFLLEGIEIGKTVNELDLSRNFIGDTGVEMFLRHMKDDSSLREVNLENCGITAAGCSTLSDVILTNKSLRNLDLSVNFIGDQGILKLSNALDRNKHIKTLGLNMCGISNDGFSKLLDILEGNATLTMLKLCYNRLGREHSNPEATSDNLKYRVRIVTSSNPKLKLLLWGNTFEESNAISQFKELNATL
ncbi:uncharacterized protein LOC123530216 isoform X2 [Mercenaria mercenaria]|uniref:uncharacterized protein LOC123530216 isoform X2 n=1 Tax=Mercenaria mercenaria TaxID=6596 RepID=UPI001E1DD6EA|nr:uncharacterized protein LOC123530216 isoform X2 [Mercenaria mercenaria]